MCPVKESNVLLQEYICKNWFCCCKNWFLFARIDFLLQELISCCKYWFFCKNCIVCLKINKSRKKQWTSYWCRTARWFGGDSNLGPLQLYQQLYHRAKLFANHALFCSLLVPVHHATSAEIIRQKIGCHSFFYLIPPCPPPRHTQSTFTFKMSPITRNCFTFQNVMNHTQFIDF